MSRIVEENSPYPQGFCGKSHQNAPGAFPLLWSHQRAAAEPGKVIEGLTIKQEISAIREALHTDSEEFMSQYGGMQGAVERYKELMMLPEAAALPKGVSIDDYSTYRATRFSEPV